MTVHVIPGDVMDRVIQIDKKELRWSVEDGSAPTILVGTGPYKRSLKVEAAPNYPHCQLKVAIELTKVEALFPTGSKPTIYLSPFDSAGRFNGTTYHDYDYNKEDEHKRASICAWIVLWGKRVPPHPAMTRYLVAHEYGHVVEEWIAHQIYTEKNPQFRLRKEYAKLRGVEDTEALPGLWHRAPGEIFANDFRLVVCNTETEFWPHEVPRPQEVPAVMDWWKARLYEMEEWRKKQPLVDVKLAS